MRVFCAYVCAESQSLKAQELTVYRQILSHTKIGRLKFQDLGESSVWNDKVSSIGVIWHPSGVIELVGRE